MGAVSVFKVGNYHDQPQVLYIYILLVALVRVEFHSLGLCVR